jgi:glycosyltransferase involved in cell wall biosynthesis
MSTDLAALRVLHLGKYYPPHMGGIETHLETLCPRLQKEIPELRIAVASDSATSSDEVFNGVRVHRAATWFHLAGAPICPSLISFIKRERPGLVHIHWPNPFAVLALLLSGYRGRLVMTYHSDVVRQRTWANFFAPFLNRVLSLCDAIIVTSPDYLSSSPVLKPYHDKCRVIPYGIDTHWLSTDSSMREAEEIRNRFSGPVILAVGRLIYYKGFEFLVQAMEQVEASALIIGDGPLRKKLDQLADRAGTRDKVHLLGEIKNEDTRPYFQACDLFVLPSIARSEAFGIVQLEAMACGKPVINTQLDSGVPFVSRRGETGLTVPPGDVDALAGAISQLMADDSLRHRFGDAGRRRVEAEFTAERMVERTLALYREIMSR